MDDRAPAEELPTLYRAVLDAVAGLEAVGERAAAHRIRGEALRTYSTNWSDSGRRRLQRLERDARQALEARTPVRAVGGARPA